MDEWRERVALQRIVALLLSLAHLAELANERAPAVRALALCVLRPAERIARDFVLGAACPVARPGDGASEARRLAKNFRALARALRWQAQLGFVPVRDSGASGFSPRAAVRGMGHYRRRGPRAWRQPVEGRGRRWTVRAPPPPPFGALLPAGGARVCRRVLRTPVNGKRQAPLACPQMRVYTPIHEIRLPLHHAAARVAPHDRAL